MTRFTPECLARTDFSRLIRNNPTSARERLEALVADPEALDLYGEELCSRAVAGHRLIDYLGWDELRRRILREGLGESTLDDETLARLAQDLDALTELQFDLFSIETPPDSWQRALAMELLGRERPKMYQNAQSADPVDDREIAGGTLEDFLNPGELLPGE